MLDTNICIYAITYGELMHGVEKSQSIEKKRIAPTLFLSPITILEYRRFYGKEKLLANHFNLSASQLKVRTVNFQGDKQIISLFRFLEKASLLIPSTQPHLISLIQFHALYTKKP